MDQILNLRFPKDVSNVILDFWLVPIHSCWEKHRQGRFEWPITGGFVMNRKWNKKKTQIIYELETFRCSPRGISDFNKYRIVRYRNKRKSAIERTRCGVVPN